MSEKKILTQSGRPLGLTPEDVQQRVEQGLINTPVDAGSKTNKQIIKENTITYFNIIFFVLAILVTLVGSFRSLTFLPVIIGNTLIGIVQEIRARNTLEKMNLVSAAHTTVVREGIQQSILSSELVQDDIVIFSAGDQIPADAVVIQGSVQVNEALLTGESDEIEKNPRSELMSGSFVVSGRCFARLTRVGSESYISKLTLEAKAQPEKEQSEMIRSINKLIMIVGIAIIPIGLILFYQSFFVNHEAISESVVSMVAAVIGMIPEGLYLLTTIALAVSMIRLASHKVLLHDMKSIETLAHVDVLCVDKTGTITENNMVVQALNPTESYKNDHNDPNDEQLNALLSDFVANMTADNITMKAMKQGFNKGMGRSAGRISSFSSQYKYCSASFGEDTFVLGAPEMVLRDAFGRYQNQVDGYSQQGYRVLVFGRYSGDADGKELTEPFEAYGFVLLSNAIRENAKETFEYFQQQDVTVKVISGDNPRTVSEVAKQAGIANAGNYIDARSFRNEQELARAAEEYTVFGRVTPEQKRLLVQSMQGAGHTVAMTGDGVNDILAMKDADCSVAMGSGSEAAAQSAQVVLLDSDFSRMPEVVLEGRRVVNNIQRSASLFLVKNIFSFLMAMFSAIFMITYPLEPSQISLISLFNIGIPGFLLALEANTKRIDGKFMKNVLVKALPAGLTDFLAIAALVTCGHVFNLPSEDIATAATMLLAIVGFMILAKISKPLNVLRTVVLVGNILALIICSVCFKQIFAMEELSEICTLLFVVFSFASESMFRILYRAAELLEELPDKAKQMMHRVQA